MNGVFHNLCDTVHVNNTLVQAGRDDYNSRLSKFGLTVNVQIQHAESS